MSVYFAKKRSLESEFNICESDEFSKTFSPREVAQTVNFFQQDRSTSYLLNRI